VLTSNQHIQNVEALANKKAKALEETKRRKEKRELTKGKRWKEKAELDVIKAAKQAKRIARKLYKAQWTNKVVKEVG